jgi:hypothetical protein
MTKYEGFCAGGPYDGKVLAWENKNYYVAVYSNPPLESYVEDDPRDLPTLDFGCYRFILGKWMWLNHVAYSGG